MNMSKQKFLCDILPEIKSQSKMHQYKKGGRCGTCKYFKMDYPYRPDDTTGYCSLNYVKGRYAESMYVVDKKSWRCQFYKQKLNRGMTRWKNGYRRIAGATPVFRKKDAESTNSIRSNRPEAVVEERNSSSP